MDYRRIEFLLDKYWECRTTVAEEDELRHFFSNEEKLPEHLQLFREIFVLQVQEKHICLTDDFDRKILSEIRKGKVRRPDFRRLVLQVAAVIVLLAIGGSLVWQQSKRNTEKQAQEQALMEVKQALAFVSLKLNRGQQILEKNMEEVKMVTQYIK